MTDLFEYIQTRKNEGGQVLGSYTVRDLNLIVPQPQTFLFTTEGKGERAGKLATVAIREVSEDAYEVDFTDTNAAKTVSYGSVSRQAVEQFLQTGLMPGAAESV
ncbi:hypothetical protein [Spirosoma rhododendri]|uniref:Uncharacterized protein n=1 Tax=Spirosoma rhododendri TaxID=2728024 RepID=A0A7L5DJP6_9BACT|nr:hypothetical protein [Spirosoma rhododendri]QJD77691.1 hypothetical protein HH216_04105 [Spirosoma rhododendri]